MGRCRLALSPRSSIPLYRIKVRSIWRTKKIDPVCRYNTYYDFGLINSEASPNSPRLRDLRRGEAFWRRSVNSVGLNLSLWTELGIDPQVQNRYILSYQKGVLITLPITCRSWAKGWMTWQEAPYPAAKRISRQWFWFTAAGLGNRFRTKHL